MKILHTEDLLLAFPNALSARLHESVTAASTLELRLAGYETAFEWQQPVQLWHKEQCIFAGKVTDIRPRGEGENYTTDITITNLLWQMDRLTLGQQLADLKTAADRTAALANTNNRMYWRQSQMTAMANWQTAAESCNAQAAGWSVRGQSIGVQVAPDLPSIGRTLRREGAVSQWTALRALQQANPGSIFRVDYENGLVCIENAIEKNPPQEWNTAQKPITMAALTPRYADVVTGVAVAVSYPSGTKLVTHPAAVQAGDEGVRLFTATADTATQAQRQADYILAQLPAYYTAASTLQNSGSVRVAAGDIEHSPIGQQLRFTGAGISPLWAAGINIVSATAWDLLTGQVDLTIGLSISNPRYDELSFPHPINSSIGSNSGGGGGSGGGGYTPDFPDPPPYIPESSESRETAETAETDDGSATAETAEPPCPCAEKWAELELWKTALELRLQEMQHSIEAELHTALSAEIDTALAHVLLQIQVNGVLEHSEWGNVEFTTTAATRRQ